MPTKRELDIVFGEDSIGDTAEERAATSKRIWVRGQDQFGLFRDGATGLTMTSVEVLEVFGFEKLFEAIDYGAAVIPCDIDEPMRSIIKRRERLGLTVEEVAKRASLPVEAVLDAENTRTRTAMNIIVKICRVLDLDPRSIGFRPIE